MSHPNAPIYWHVGLHKTATTWLQRGLFAEHPEIALINDPSAPWDDPIVSYIVSTSEYDFSAGELRRRISNRIKSETTAATKAIVISAERLSGHPISGHYDRFSIARRIAAATDNLHMLITLRDPATLIPSIYQQMVKEGFSGTFRDLVNMPSWKRPGFDLAAYDFEQVLDQYNRILREGKISVFLFEHLKSNSKSYLNRWVTELGVAKFEPSNLGSKANPRTPDDEIIFLAAANDFRRSPLNPSPSYNLYHVISRFEWLKRITLQILHRRGITFLPTKKERASLRARFSEYPKLVENHSTTTQRV